jgi:NAD(P)-dependent dehydrogenase (short-subunit alcohol dehydrogenase family)
VDLELTGRRALVTGGTRGIGLAVGRALAAEGADVALVGRDTEALERQAAALAAASGTHVVAIPADTGEDRAVAAMAAAAREQLGGVDILVNAAATPSAWPGLTEDDLEREINVKVRGYLRCVRAFAPEMAERGWGRVINVGGIALRHSVNLVGAVRNAAVVSMTKSLADELGPQGINVTVVHPGWTRTERTERILEEIAAAVGSDPASVERERAAEVSIGRLVSAEEVAAVIAFLASPLSVAVNGDAVVASGGIRGATYY